VSIRQIAADKVVDEIKQYGGTLIKTKLCHENEAKIREALTAAQQPAWGAQFPGEGFLSTILHQDEFNSLRFSEYGRHLVDEVWSGLQEGSWIVKDCPVNGEGPGKNVANELAKQRNRHAAERTLMAWVRTSLSLIGFGFGIASFRDILLEAGLLRGPQFHWCTTLVFGLSFIFLGVFGLLAATIQHWRILHHLKQDRLSYTEYLPLAFIMAIVLMLIGLFAFLAVLLH
jgi:putative membrane protein